MLEKIRGDKQKWNILADEKFINLLLSLQLDFSNLSLTHTLRHICTQPRHPRRQIPVKTTTTKSTYDAMTKEEKCYEYASS